MPSRLHTGFFFAAVSASRRSGRKKNPECVSCMSHIRCGEEKQRRLRHWELWWRGHVFGNCLVAHDLFIEASPTAKNGSVFLLLFYTNRTILGCAVTHLSSMGFNLQYEEEPMEGEWGHSSYKIETVSAQWWIQHILVLIGLKEAAAGFTIVTKELLVFLIFIMF